MAMTKYGAQSTQISKTAGGEWEHVDTDADTEILPALKPGEKKDEKKDEKK